jgi:hypothetical protein
MRFSPTAPLTAQDLTAERISNEDLARRAMKAIGSAAARTGTLLLAGGRSYADLVVRQAQAHLRVDHLASYWSHAAVIIEWRGEPATAWGVEVSLDPVQPDLQVPERNGATVFDLRRYFDGERYPNLAFADIAFRSPPAAAGKARNAPRPADPKQLLFAAAVEPLRDQVRFPFLDWLAAWRAFTTAPYRFTNPSRENLPHPGAAFCEYVLEAAHVDITPGATAPNSCPETIWATLLRWHQQMAATGVDLRVWYVARDPRCAAREPLAKSLAPAPAGKQPAGGAAKRRRKRTR